MPVRPQAIKLLRSQRGVALLIALFAMTLMLFIAMEVSYDTNIEYVVASQQVSRLKAYYAARAGIELGLLRIMIYKQVVSALGDKLGGNISMIDPIWQFPFTWPPVMPDSVTNVDKSLMDAVIKKSLMDAQYVTTIQAEGNKIDINDLGSEVKALREATKNQILKIFRGEIERNEEFGRKYSGYRFDELINNISDWVDEDDEGLNGGSEKSNYDNLQNQFIPPNQSFKTLQELHMVAGMTDEFYNLLIKHITIYGTKGVNINYGNHDQLLALDPSMNEDAVKAILERRSNPALGGPFKSQEEFLDFVRGFGVNSKSIEESKIPLVFETEFNFRIQSSGIYGKSKRDINAITFDVDNVAQRLATFLDKQAEQEKNSQGSNPQDPAGASSTPSDTKDDKKNQTQNKIKAPKGRPTVVSWEET